MYEHIFKDIEPTDAETELIEAAALGDFADFRTGDEGEDDPVNAENWGEERNLRAEVIFALLVEGRADWPVHPRGVLVIGARIVGQLDLSNAELSVPLDLLGCRLDSALALYNCRAKFLNLSGSQVAGINADGLAVSGSVHLRNGFTSKGKVRLLGATVGGNFDGSDATFENDEGSALSADGIDVKGDVFLQNCIAKGEVRFPSATVGGSFDGSGARFENAKAIALECGRFNVKGSVFLKTCTVKGEVRFNGAKVGSNFELSGTTFANEDGDALSADGLDVKGSVLLNSCTVNHMARFVGATVGGDFNCSNATFVNPDDAALVLERARVTRTLWFTFAKPPVGGLNLLHASAGQLVDSPRIWPAAGDLLLDGFEYGAFAGSAPTGWEDRLRWLKLQQEPHLKADFKPQPWEQVVAVLRRMGHDADARKIAIAKQDSLLKSGLRNRWRWRLWHGFLGETIKYGYESWRALIWMAVIILIGTVIFRDADRADLIVPAKERVYLDHRYEATQGKWLPPEYPSFAPLVYAADVFVPILDLHQETHWRPATSKGVWGWAVTIFMWFYILLGWVFTTLAVAGLTGLVRQRAER